MKNKEQLKKLFDKAKGDNEYYTFEYFQEDAKRFIRDIKKTNVIMAMKVSKSGMTRHFNIANRYNMLVNICYNEKLSFDPVKINGCGMDMAWYLLYQTAQDLMTKSEIEKYKINSKCSSYQLLSF